MDYIFDEIRIMIDPFMVQFKTIFPFWVIGLVLSAFITAYAENAMEKAAGRLSSGRYGIVYLIAACLLGIASPLCMYGTVPLIAMLARKGVPQGILVGFMISSILLNPTLMVMTLALGFRMFAARIAMALAAGIAAGILVMAFFKKRRVFRVKSFAEESGKVSRTRFRQFLHSLRRNFEVTAPYFLVGLTLTVILQRYIPIDLFTAVLGENSPYAILVSASIGVPLYMCGGGTIPLIQAWLQAGMSAGAACAFMMSGPATKLNNLSAVKMILGKFNFILYIVYCMAFSLIAGYVANWIF